MMWFDKSLSYTGICLEWITSDLSKFAPGTSPVRGRLTYRYTYLLSMPFVFPTLEKNLLTFV